MMKVDLAHWAQLLNLLASACRTAPQTPEFAPIQHFFQTPDWPALWPEPADDIATLQPELNPSDLAALHEQWLRLFIGPASLPAPAWGSVWLDPEQALQGESTLRLMAFLNQQGIRLHTDYPEPADHIGLMLFQSAWLAMKNRPRALQQLLEEHVMTWLPMYVGALNAAQPCGFYRALGELILKTLQQMQNALKNAEPARIL